MADKKKLQKISAELKKASQMHAAQAKKIDNMSKGPSMINLAAAIGAKLGGKQKNPNKDTSVGNVPPHSHSSNQNNDTMNSIGNITGNLNNNLKVQQLGADLFQGEALAEQEMAKRNLGKPVMPPSPDPVGDQLGNMFNQPFAQNGNLKKYETGELLDDEDFSKISGQNSIAVVKYSDIQEDKKGQYVTSLGPKEFIKQPYDKKFKRPTSSTHIDQWSHKEVERDTIRPRSGKTFISTWKKNK
jgi:hypothetical protein